MGCGHAIINAFLVYGLPRTATFCLVLPWIAALGALSRRILWIACIYRSNTRAPATACVPCAARLVVAPIGMGWDGMVRGTAV
jgi:hypothetical protein